MGGWTGRLPGQRRFPKHPEDAGPLPGSKGRRETQQEHHAERKRSQDAGEPFTKLPDASMTLAQIGDVQPGVNTAA